MPMQLITRSRRLWRWLLAHPWLLLALFVAVLLLLGLLSLLTQAVTGQHRFVVGDPLRLALHRLATPAMDAGLLWMSRLGAPWVVVPLDVGILLGLAWRRRAADGLFFRLAVGGAALLKQATTLIFSHQPPNLWAALAPEPPFRFPSGHALNSMAMVAAVVVLVWPTRWRVAALVGGGLGTLLVGLARLYLGVQHPSDVLAGWAAALAWVLGLSMILYGRLGKPATAPPDAPPMPAPAAIVLPTSGVGRTERDPH